MALKASSPTLLLLYVTFALLLFLLLASFSRNTTTLHRHHRRLKLRTNLSSLKSGNGVNHTDFAFDPLIADFEQRIEDHRWDLDHQFDSNHPPEDLTEWEEYMKAENYINDEDRFNITDRIIQLFPLIDVNPTDGHVSAQELTTWHLNQDKKQTLHRAQKELELHDKNKDGFISFEEYEPPHWVSEPHIDKEGWMREDHFNASDIDGNGLLNITEFSEFLHSTEDSNPKLIKWLCKQIIRESDTNKDGKLDFKEFLIGLYDRIKEMNEDHDESSQNSGDLKSNHLFVQLDSDFDGCLSEDEVVPIVSKLHPSETHYVKDHVDYIMSAADEDKDGYLSLKEMIDNQYILYGTVYQDEDDYHDHHDEFR